MHMMCMSSHDMSQLNISGLQGATECDHLWRCLVSLRAIGAMGHGSAPLQRHVSKGLP